MHRRICLIGITLLIMALLGAGCSTAKKPAPAPKSPPKTQSTGPATLLEAAGKDSNTNGCFSCHTVETNGVAGIKNYPAAGYRENVPGPAGGGAGATPGQGTVKSTEGNQTLEKTQPAKKSKGQTTTPQGNTNQQTESELPVPTP